MGKPVLIDVCCCAGGASRGYQQAGFKVIGIDKDPQPHYVGDEFIQADITAPGFDWLGIVERYRPAALHGSPPCQFASELTPVEYKANHPNLIPLVREMFQATGLPYVIENVAGARKHLHNPVMLCGSMFGLPIWRHRFFENNIGLWLAPATCNHSFVPVVVSGVTTRRTPVLVSGRGMRGAVAGTRRKENTAEEKRQAMGGLDWMVEREVTEAIPPAYTAWLGQQLLAEISRLAARR